MPLFAPTGSGFAQAVTVPPFRVFVSRCTPNADPTQDPVYADFVEEPRLQALSLFRGSTAGGISHASLKLAVGAPLTNSLTRLEQYDVLHQGDRVLIGLGNGNKIQWLWAGYQTAARLNISKHREAEVFRLSGPEWFLGTGAQTGAHKVVFGQVRRTASADDRYFASAGGEVTNFSDMAAFTDERAVFNPRGQRNMSTADVRLNVDDNEGRCWEIPERLRRSTGTPYSAFWTKLDALKTIWTWFNDPDVSGIDNPDWSEVDATLQVGSDPAVLRDCDVDGLSLWEATRKILGPEYGFFVNPVPPGKQWGQFKVHFFARGLGDPLQLTLNPLGTPAEKAIPGIVRLEASKDISKTVNKVAVLGKHIRHIKLQYNGSDTPTLGGSAKKIALQHGWSKHEGDITIYADANHNVEWHSIDSTAGHLDTWFAKFCTTGAQFEQYKHIFRLFVWNEAGEFYPSPDDSSSNPAYGQTPTDAAWWTPDLTGIADDDDHAGKYSRRRRPLLDTTYQDGDLDSWRRVPPTLWIAAIDPQSSSQGDWVQVHPGHYRFDHERAALWITAPDLAQWRPFDTISVADDASIPDNRNFSTLLHTGKLRMLVEGSIETDWALKQTADRQSTSGSPFVRQIVQRNPRDYIKSEAYSDGITSPAGLTGNAVDTSADALNAAEQARQAGQDQQVHSSLTVSASYPVGTAIGNIASIVGRALNLSGGGNTGGPQIVGAEMDCEGLVWELITESDALRLRRMKRRKVLSHRVRNRGGARAGGAGHETGHTMNAQAGDGPTMAGGAQNA